MTIMMAMIMIMIKKKEKIKRPVYTNYIIFRGIDSTKLNRNVCV
jgi:hypothetical protein